METWEVIETLPLQGCEPDWQPRLKAWELESEHNMPLKANVMQGSQPIAPVLKLYLVLETIFCVEVKYFYKDFFFF